MTLHDFICSTYNALLDADWHMSEIDGMDMPGYFRVRAWQARKGVEHNEPKPGYIDTVWPSMRSK